MTAPRVGALFAGYGGIELALHEVLGAEPAWFSEIEPAPSRILAHHWPDVPNHGDVTAIDWAAVEPVDIIAGGSPCQDLSHAGKRAGMKAGTRSGLWVSMCDAIDIIRPSLVVWENVRGALSAPADSAVEPCPICVGDGGRVSLRALGRVLGDLAELGYDAAWTGLRAADVGAPHGRWRVFLLAWPADSPDADSATGRRDVAGGIAPGPQERTLLEARWGVGRDRGAHPGAADTWGSRDWRDLTLLRTPTAQRGSSGDTHHTGTTLTDATVRQSDRFGQYAPAIARWEALTRPAPDPTEPTGRDGAHRLSPRFVEWMMGLPAGWVTDVPGVSRNDQLKALGNGVVPQQAAAALRWLLATGHIGRAAA